MDAPRTMMRQQQNNPTAWVLDRTQQQHLHPESSGINEPSSSSTSSNSPPFTLGSASSPLESANGALTIPNTTYPHTVGPHRRQPSGSRNSGSSDNIFGSMAQSSARTFDPRPGHPYAFATSFPPHNVLHGQAARRRKFSTPLDAMTEDQRLEDLWTMHGVTGSAHLGMGLTDQFATTNLAEGDWIVGMNGSRPMEEPFDPTFYNATSTDHFTVGQNLRETFDLHNPFTEGLFSFPENDLLAPRDAEMDVGDEILETKQEESPHSDEQELMIRGNSTTDDSDATAGPLESTPIDVEDDKDGVTSDHEQQSDDKAHASRPAANNFVHKLHLMISDPKAADFIWWTELGASFIVSSAGEFSREILGQHFKHNNFASFVRQLNMYGFHKINRTPRNQRVQSDAQQWEFSHPKFLRGRLDLLEDIRRRPVEPDPSSARSRVELPSEVAAKLREMATNHAEVVAALQHERRRVSQLSALVKLLYDRLAPTNSLPAFPHELLETGPPLRKHKEGGMGILGDSLVRSNPEPPPNSRGSQALTGARSKRPRTDTDIGSGQTELDQRRGATDPTAVANVNGRNHSSQGSALKQESLGLGR
ncbi:hypothetical protein FRC14_004641 [Serendipita sp. 396]|nr:hypothetical protein FRC14_004641 [Serendipita sp. 396]KAG8781993.1 hypothetical protein FRC15_007768 [Serendipita sp. 397]KAG8798037.1 hypothetical protein FRC16_008153 [Serendipita sp. 398]KAG8830221.1 hypothetical protein FRC18_008525 [Serendipita sp. 400]